MVGKILDLTTRSMFTCNFLCNRRENISSSYLGDLLTFCLFSEHRAWTFLEALHDVERSSESRCLQEPPVISTDSCVLYICVFDFYLFIYF